LGLRFRGHCEHLDEAEVLSLTEWCQDLRKCSTQTNAIKRLNHAIRSHLGCCLTTLEARPNGSSAENGKCTVFRHCRDPLDSLLHSFMSYIWGGCYTSSMAINSVIPISCILPSNVALRLCRQLTVPHVHHNLVVDRSIGRDAWAVGLIAATLLVLRLCLLHLTLL
jgi:hypothetical protein